MCRAPAPQPRELANLSVSRGTLTDEDLYTINGIVQTIRMLDAAFPSTCGRCLRSPAAKPREDGRHGLPRGLTGDEIEPVARMMAIADIFEFPSPPPTGLSKGKTLSEAVAIMSRMRDEGTSTRISSRCSCSPGCSREYAEAHMSADHVDEVDVDRALAGRAESEKARPVAPVEWAGWAGSRAPGRAVAHEEERVAYWSILRKAPLRYTSAWPSLRSRTVSTSHKRRGGLSSNILMTGNRNSRQGAFEHRRTGDGGAPAAVAEAGVAMHAFDHAGEGAGDFFLVAGQH